MRRRTGDRTYKKHRGETDGQDPGLYGHLKLLVLVGGGAPMPALEQGPTEAVLNAAYR
jgi:hypothetical protein